MQIPSAGPTFTTQRSIYEKRLQASRQHSSDTLSAGALGSAATGSAVDDWYRQLEKPSFNPPPGVFGPVWTVLYILMGVGLYLVWRKPAKGKRGAYAAFGVQLFLNSMWSVIFFGWKTPLWAFVEIFFLFAAIVVTTVLFWRISRAAAILLFPYLIWVTFASVLIFRIWQLN